MTLEPATGILETRLAELREYLAASVDVDKAARVLEKVIETTDLRPGLFADENGRLEARWFLRPRDSVTSVILNVTFGETVDAYSFDRATEKLADDTTWVYDDKLVAKLLAVIERVLAGAR